MKYGAGCNEAGGAAGCPAPDIYEKTRSEAIKNRISIRCNLCGIGVSYLEPGPDILESPRCSATAGNHTAPGGLGIYISAGIDPDRKTLG